MAIREIVTFPDERLRQIWAPVTEFDDALKELTDDMFETMYEEDGVGLAASQVGVLRQIVTIDVDDGNQYVLINPEILETSGEQTGYEGCLSVPGKRGIVTRPDHVKVRALNEDMEPYELEGDGLLARAICHECDHLKGSLYVDLVEGKLEDLADLAEEEAEGED